MFLNVLYVFIRSISINYKGLTPQWNQPSMLNSLYLSNNRLIQS